MRIDINNVKIFFLLSYKSKLEFRSSSEKKEAVPVKYPKKKKNEKEDPFSVCETCGNQSDSEEPRLNQYPRNFHRQFHDSPSTPRSLCP